MDISISFKEVNLSECFKKVSYVLLTTGVIFGGMNIEANSQKPVDADKTDPCVYQETIQHGQGNSFKRIYDFNSNSLMVLVENAKGGSALLSKSFDTLKGKEKELVKKAAQEVPAKCVTR
jgi:hypothetical protein